ncbi:MAG: DNA-processing protein DprA [Bacteroidales bacterium]
MKTHDDEIFYAIALSGIKGIGPVIARKLIDEVGSPAELFREKPEILRKIPRIGEILANGCRSCAVLDPAEKEMDFIRNHHIRAIYFGDPEYPERLRDCVDAPILLFLKGSVDLNSRHIISIVGTRDSTHYGRDLLEQFTKDLAEQLPDALIVSGLAYGIDVTAHRCALQNKLHTIGVVAHGLDRLYPDAHKQVAKEMLSQGGGLVTEYPSGTNADKGNFIARNRIIAGMADATILVETADKGGSIITANIANTYGRDVFAFPGRVNDLRSRGCNRLIRQNRAGLITSADDFLEMMNWLPDTHQHPAKQLPLDFDLSEEEQLLVGLLRQYGEMQLNRLAIETEKPISVLTGILMDLELRHIVRSYPGGVYRTV